MDNSIIDQNIDSKISRDYNEKVNNINITEKSSSQEYDATKSLSNNSSENYE